MTAVQLSARSREMQLLDLCHHVAAVQLQQALTDEQANVLHVASMLIFNDRPEKSDRLRAAAQAHFNAHPESEVSTQEVVRKRWIIGLPRFQRALLERMKGTLNGI